MRPIASNDRRALIEAIQGSAGNNPIQYNQQPQAAPMPQSSVLQRAPSLVMGQAPPPPQNTLANIIADPMRKIKGVNDTPSLGKLQSEMSRYMPRSQAQPGNPGQPNVMGQPGPGAGMGADFDNPGGDVMMPTPSQTPQSLPTTPEAAPMEPPMDVGSMKAGGMAGGGGMSGGGFGGMAGGFGGGGFSAG